MSKVKAQSSNFPLTFILSPRSLCRNRRKRYVCHSERSEESRRISVFQPIDSTRFFTSFRMTDIAFPPIMTQSLPGGERGGDFEKDLQLIFKFPQQFFSPGNPILFFHSFGGGAIDDAQNSSSLIRLSQNHLHRIGCGAEDVADFLAHLYRVEDIDWEGILQNNIEGMASPNSHGILHGHFLERLIISFSSDQAVAGRLAESNSEFGIRNRSDDNLIKILDCLNEVGLTKNDITSLKNI